uniref:Uncharacterized protein n=1 Tax=Lotharella globosa TaxID=91324 RepID=A0A7S3YP88_9EUKA|mmetsp:Transcript_10034/g.19815  ORF Transcript_10034/g.19815 Transcript_10034/m.19815 type:complete len:355 (-) Transcript_10034:202-1266(-)
MLDIKQNMEEGGPSSKAASTGESQSKKTPATPAKMVHHHGDTVIPLKVVGEPPPGSQNSGLQRGYIARFNWRTHYVNRFDPASIAPGQSITIGPAETELLPSIPTIFHRLLSILQQVERANKNRDILGGLDRKIVRQVAEVTSASSRSLDRKLVLTNLQGQEYLVNACRKEHVKLIYEGMEGKGLLEKLGLCNHLVDVFAVAPGRSRYCVGGRGVRNHHALPCTCDGGVGYDAKEGGMNHNNHGMPSNDLYKFKSDRAARFQQEHEPVWKHFETCTAAVKRSIENTKRPQPSPEKIERIDALRAQIAKLRARCLEMAQRWHAEKDLRARLWARLELMQKKLLIITSRIGDQSFS